MFQVVLVSETEPSVVIGTAESADAATVAFHAALRSGRPGPARGEVQLRDLRDGSRIVLRMPLASSVATTDWSLWRGSSLAARPRP
jgi:hypothetical protein